MIINLLYKLSKIQNIMSDEAIRFVLFLTQTCSGQLEPSESHIFQLLTTLQQKDFDLQKSNGIGWITKKFNYSPCGSVTSQRDFPTNFTTPFSLTQHPTSNHQTSCQIHPLFIFSNWQQTKYIPLLVLHNHSTGWCCYSIIKLQVGSNIDKR